MKTEQEILDYWDENKVFEKSVEQRPEDNVYRFYDGPPFATGLPHYGHIAVSLIKDVVPRYFTMRGFRVERRWGWDCHGLPIENIIEKELNLKTKKDIDDFGIANFNNACRAKVMTYAKDWGKTVRKIGRFVDMENSYKTMDADFMESVWWVFSKLWEKELIYRGHKPMHICPRCATPLSNFEASLEYKDVEDISATVEFKLLSEKYKNTFALAWTTTPWTLPGNMLLAVASKTQYVLFSASEPNKYYLSAKDKVKDVVGNNSYRIEETLKGSDLVGIGYEPLLPYFKNSENAFRIVAADFVSSSEGTGIVHIAPAFGEDDYNLGQKEKLKLIQPVTIEGKFTPEVTDFAGEYVKPIGDPMATDKKIIDYLKKIDRLWAEKVVSHSYPHCWRCDSPLINYAADSWFVNVTKIKDQLIANNKKINWVPAHIKEGRFGQWLEGAKDWAISRNRYWGTPLPIWRCDKQNGGCGHIKVIGSQKELEDHIKNRNKFIFVRHGESEKNILRIATSTKDGYQLTKNGVDQVSRTAFKLKGLKPTKIYSSPIERARQTADIIGKGLGVEVTIDERLWEAKVGKMEGKPVPEPTNYYHHYEVRSEENELGLESYQQVTRRMVDFIREINSINNGETIVVVSHGDPLWLLEAELQNKINSADILTVPYIKVAEPREVAVNIIDLHRPYIDEVEIPCEKCPGKMSRIPEVLDCWFESGSMPYAQLHYPFENEDKFLNSFPAQFIAEGQDQTRGWFYTLHILATALTSGNNPVISKQSVPAFLNVIVNGIVLAADGKKMSKRLNNYPDPEMIIDKYSADAMRYYLISSPIMEAEDLNFNEQSVKEIQSKIITILNNVLTFYLMYRCADNFVAQSDNILDRWITARQNQLINTINEEMEGYRIARASRPILNFVSDLSQWYVRRSRDRFKSGGQDNKFATATLRNILYKFSQAAAPFIPFITENIFIELKTAGDPVSIHLTDFPKAGEVDTLLLDRMEKIRDLISRGLALRSENNLKVRQPLASATISGFDIAAEEEKLFKDELNVLEIRTAKGKIGIDLDLNLTAGLRDEGKFRDIIRAVQDARKKALCRYNDKVLLSLSGLSDRFINQYKTKIEAATLTQIVAKIEDVKINSTLNDITICIGK